MSVKYRTLILAKSGLFVLILVASCVLLTLYCTTELIKDGWIFSRCKIDLNERILGEDYKNCVYTTLFSRYLKNSSAHNEWRYSQQTDTSTFWALKNSTDLIRTVVKANIVLIDPFILFCMLSPSYKKLLWRRQFSLHKFMKSSRALTFGINAEVVPELEKAETEFLRLGHKIQFFGMSAPAWMNAGDASLAPYVSHALIQMEDWTIHLVVFYERGDFLWHGDLGPPPNSSISEDALLFTDSPSAYEKFDYFHLDFEKASMSHLYIPSNPHQFLFQIDSSKFLECNTTVVSQFNGHQRVKSAKDRSETKEALFEKRMLLSLKELKNVLAPMFISFFIWSGTLLGWYRQCGVIPYTSDVDYGAWATEVDDVDNILRRVNHSDQLLLKEIMGTKDIGLEFNFSFQKLRVDLFFVYHESNGTWYAGHRPSKRYFFKYHHPNFTLCSAELLQQKVLVPCESEKVIETEYGPNWMKPVSSWNYEKSIFNRGPNIYWKNLSQA